MTVQKDIFVKIFLKGEEVVSFGFQLFLLRLHHGVSLFVDIFPAEGEADAFCLFI